MVAKEIRDQVEDPSSESEIESKHLKEDVSDCDTVKDFISSQGDAQTTEDDKVERISKVPKKVAKKEPVPRLSKTRKDRQEANKTQSKSLSNTPKKPAKSNRGVPRNSTKTIPDGKSKIMKVHPKPSSESSEGIDDGNKPIEEVKEIDNLNEAPNEIPSIGSDNEASDVEENCLDEGEASNDQRIEEMEARIRKLEEELREVAGLEISLYSVVPEHGSSSHKVHTPARRLSRLYLHSCKHPAQNKRGTIAKNTVSGLILIAKSCGNDVPRLTFWLSNTVVLREILSQAFGNSLNLSPISRVTELNDGAKRSEGKSTSNQCNASGWDKQGKNSGLTQILEVWQETRSYISALEKVESWIFSRIVESVWWQTLTPHMQPPVEDLYSNRSQGKLSGPALGNQQQGNFSINLWTSAFKDAFQRLCPLRAAGHECGCLPVLARLVMEQCVARLDVAMFNAILRESANEIPTDPVSDPIVDSKVLPILAGNLSFGSGAQLKNSVGNWSRWLTDLFGMDTDESPEDSGNDEDEDRNGRDVVPKSFRLLNALSDLLMLPKDMLIDRSIRKEVCPAIDLPLIKRILCNFTPDEFCPDPVPGVVLEALNAESIVEMQSSDGDSTSFPVSAATVVYVPPSHTDVQQKVGDNIGERSKFERNVSVVQRKGYTSDEELDELDSPLTSIIDKMPAPTTADNGTGKHNGNTKFGGASVRYELLREVWIV
ncbi:uncharacterized protein LOC113323169 [Papaver somniferum]|uniref:uncharacterized protein LOC113323169 n=1 Tax=Papaver somniferum TaxID=3469 RepID=UPI000E703C52|nr:uncharacterized protein LOC113323169 [Papaver somniferum]XP_026427227.1 uncharacterized protein LOC113323169 [Papaver somniferum]XP_026427228.1 uncharacterized protein LOC113323169 [Papaver somniferum]XP_026427229.1 uncharacterized protein LOC113323169 [Papaver somniferum]XP_026427230.1 uncharacterized protein LOC113323169 [Papaver somniferum]